MNNMDRREFLVAALGSASLLGASRLWGDSLVHPSIQPDAIAQVYTRRNIYCLNAGSPEIRAYRTAIKAMQQLPDTDGTSWLAQANIHGALTPPPGMITDVCQHNTLFFLSWHRMYVYFFERIVRHKSGDPKFALPYWAYSPTGRRDLPRLFRHPANANNLLYTANRNPSINAGNPIQPQLVDAGLALGQIAFNPFTNSLNGTPHGMVHIAVGGGMSSFQQAARDPIFWLHHCNIDRLWELWLATGGGRANPTGNASWMNTPFNFYDETGGTVSLTGAQIVNIASQLHYRYESDVCGRPVVLDPKWRERHTRFPGLPEHVVEKLTSLGKRPPLRNPEPLVQAQDQVKLGGKPTELPLPVSAEGKRRLAEFQEDAQAGGEINLVLEDIRVEGRPRVFYEIYINLPPGRTSPTYTSPHYAGNVNFFGPAPEKSHGKEREPQIVPLSLVYLRLKEAKAWSDDTVRVTFVPRGLTEGEDPARVLGKATQATIGRISLQIQ
jgi:tyrosinase